MLLNAFSTVFATFSCNFELFWIDFALFFSARGCKRRGEPLASPCPGQRSESRRVCVCCVKCNHYCNLSTFLWLHPITLTLNYRWNKCTAIKKFFFNILILQKIWTKIIESWCIRVFQIIGILSTSKLDFQLVIWRNYRNWYRYRTCQENYRKIIVIGKYDWSLTPNIWCWES